MAGSRLNRQLGDKHLNPEEAVIREREDLLRIESKKKIWGQAELENTDRSAGPRLYYTEILRRLWLINPQLKVKEGVEGSVALYRTLEPWEYDPELPLYSSEGSRRTDVEKTDWFNHHKYVGGMEKGWLPEYSHVLLDTSHLATREIRGWRSVLLSLIKGKAISVEGAIEQFGDPSLDQRSGRWQEQIWEFKQQSRN